MGAFIESYQKICYMIIGMVLDLIFPPDIRVEKESKFLVKAGFEVLVLSRLKENSPFFEGINGVKVVRVDIKAGTFTSKSLNLINSLFFYNPIWARHIENFIKEYKIDVLHVHDLPLVGTAIKVSRNLGTKIVVDFHENYPAALQVWSKWKKKGIGSLISRLLNDYNRWLKFERYACEHVDRIITVADEMKKRLVNTHSTDPSKIEVITNTEELSFIENAKLDDKIVKSYKNKFIISYIGGFGPHRGIDTTLEGMIYVKEEIPNALLLLVGKGSEEDESTFKNLVRENNLERYVKFSGWQPFEKVYSYIYISDVGLVPHNKNEHTDHTVPHKLFQYMMVGKPVIVSDCKPLRRIVGTLKSGLVFKAGNPRDFAKNIIELYRNPELRKQLSDNGKNATLKGSVNWEITSDILVKLYKAV